MKLQKTDILDFKSGKSRRTCLKGACLVYFFILNCSDILSFWENLRPWLFAQFQFIVSRIGNHKWLTVSIVDFLGLSLSLSHLRHLSRKTNNTGGGR